MKTKIYTVISLRQLRAIVRDAERSSKLTYAEDDKKRANHCVLIYGEVDDSPDLAASANGCQLVLDLRRFHKDHFSKAAAAPDDEGPASEWEDTHLPPGF